MIQEYKDMKPEIEKFTDEMIKDYKKDNLINEFCVIQDLKNEKDLDFIQVGERVNLPKRFFIKEKGIEKYNGELASDFVRSIVNGEKDFILREIINQNINNLKISQFDSSELLNAISKLKNPTDIFFPIKKFHRQVYSLVHDESGSIKFIFGKERFLSINGKQLKVHWILDDSIDRIIVTNKSEIKISQKKFEQANNPEGIILIKAFEELSKNQKLMLYFAEKDKDNFDFVFRTILSKPQLNENSALIVEVDG